MREVTAIEPRWLTEVAPSFFKVADQNTISKRKKQEKITPLFDKCVLLLSLWDYAALSSKSADPCRPFVLLLLLLDPQVRRAPGRVATLQA